MNEEILLIPEFRANRFLRREFEPPPGYNYPKKEERVLFLTQNGGEGFFGSFGEDQPQDEGDQCLTE